jgi:hypothetical protein
MLSLINPDLIVLLKACGKEVDRLVVLFAQKCYLSYNREFKTPSGQVVTQVVPVVSHEQVTQHFLQLEKGISGERLIFERELLADIIIHKFKDGWELEAEKVVMDELKFEYDSQDLRDLNMRKGDVSKLLTLQHRNRQKQILRKIREVHGKGKFDVTRKRGRDDGDYDRNARANNVIYILDSPYLNEKKKV